MLAVDDDCSAVIVNGVNKALRVKTDEIDVFARFSPTNLHSRQDMEKEAEFLDRLAQAEAPSCRLYRHKNQPVCGPFVVGGTQYHLLFSETIHGREMIRTASDTKAFGQALGMIHALPLGRAKYGGHQFADISTSPAPSRFHDILKELGDLAEAIRPTQTKRLGLCHGDAWLGNALKYEGEAVLFDFEFSHIGDMSYDVANFIWALRSEELSNQLELFGSFVEGYRQSFNVKYSSSELRKNIVQKEINNLVFLSDHVALSPEVTAASERFAKSTIEFVQHYEANDFRWD